MYTKSCANENKSSVTAGGFILGDLHFDSDLLEIHINLKYPAWGFFAFWIRPVFGTCFGRVWRSQRLRPPRNQESPISKHLNTKQIQSRPGVNLCPIISTSIKMLFTLAIMISTIVTHGYVDQIDTNARHLSRTSIESCTRFSE